MNASVVQGGEGAREEKSMSVGASHQSEKNANIRLAINGREVHLFTGLGVYIPGQLGWNDV